MLSGHLRGMVSGVRGRKLGWLGGWRWSRMRRGNRCRARGRVSRRPSGREGSASGSRERGWITGRIVGRVRCRIRRGRCRVR
eukprot:814806-Amorphochlora_amoeboformis.AAC.2